MKQRANNRLVKARPSHINTPFQPAERAALEALAEREGRSLGQQIRMLALAQLHHLGLLLNPEPEPPPQSG